VYIDIFVLDHIPVEKNEQRKLFMDVRFYWKWIQHFQRHFKKWNKFVRKYHLPLPNLDMMARLLMKCKDKYNKQCTSLVSLTQDYQKKTDFNKSIYEYDWFKEFIEVEFENNKLPIIKAYDDMLKQTYGDYMKLPPKEQQIGHNVEAYWK
jgi:LPS biosynthesis protein